MQQNVAQNIRNTIKDLDIKAIRLVMKDLDINVTETSDKFMLNFRDTADFSKPEVRQANGLIFEKGTNKLLHFSFDKCYDADNNDPYDNIEELLSKESLSNDQTIITKFDEGSLIRVYFHKDVWNIGTSRTIDAKNSYWANNVSFDTLFRKAIEDDEHFFDNLETNKCYTFLLQCPEIRTLIPSLTYKKILLSYVDTTTFELIHIFREDRILPRDQLPKDINYMIYSTSGVVIKCLLKDFSEAKKVLGSYKDLGLIYFANLNNPEGMSILLENCPDHDFSTYDHILKVVSENLCCLYVDKYIFKSAPEIPKYYLKTINKIHRLYIDSKKSGMYFKATPQLVYNILSNLNAYTIAQICNYKY